MFLQILASAIFLLFIKFCYSIRKFEFPNEAKGADKRQQMWPENYWEPLTEVPVEWMRAVKRGDAVENVDLEKLPGNESELAVTIRVEYYGGHDGEKRNS